MFQPHKLLPHVPARLAKTFFTRKSLIDSHVFGFHCLYYCCLGAEALSFQIIRVRRHEIISCQPGDIDRLDPLYDRRISHSWNKLSAQGSGQKRFVRRFKNGPSWKKHGADLFTTWYTQASCASKSVQKSPRFRPKRHQHHKVWGRTKTTIITTITITTSLFLFTFAFSQTHCYSWTVSFVMNTWDNHNKL